MASLEGRAHEIEAELPGVVSVNVFVGFSYADVPDAGVSLSAVTMGDLEVARAGLRELNATASFRRKEGNRTGMALGEAILRLQGHSEGPVLRPGQVVVMDNLAAHKGERVRELIEGRGCEVLYLPPYSPDLKPVEEAFSKVNGVLCRTGARTREALVEAMGRAMDAVTVRDD